MKLFKVLVMIDGKHLPAVEFVDLKKAQAYCLGVSDALGDAVKVAVEITQRSNVSGATFINEFREDSGFVYRSNMT